ncbi:DUF1645 domain-containing protein [Heracleum sosnowskyi]|uniref:DUF1645 domain-containing protein n=1 Tax=Heracleum sosnowskyi TaxID=360622 RepID=A0AAD8MAN4_9APIA|nr:DUF1645 domain-containing protein [Heracleum sosnowskyi]
MDSKLNESQLKTHQEEDEDEAFTFAINARDDAFDHGQIRPIYPLFNRDLLLAHDDFSLPLRPPVENVFIQSPARKSDVIDRIAAGPYCAGSKSPEMSKKSNSTGFSKLWRFREYMQRSNSDGRNAYVFFNHENKNYAGEASSEKKAVVEEKKKVKKVDKTMSSHEVYLKKKGYNPEDKRKSYLPYRPELVGFFTNVKGGGLSKNVHPY